MSSQPAHRDGTSLGPATLVAVALGGSAGALLRWLLELGLPAGSGWPWATLLANVLGSAALGWLVARDELHPVRGWLRAGAGTGLLGGFTTFSTYAVQVAVLEASGNPASFARLLAEGGCKDVTEAAYRDLGVAQRGSVTWLVLAAPLEAPAAGEAATTNARVLALVNEARTEKRRCGFRRFDAVPPLAPSAALQRAASAHAEDMARLFARDQPAEIDAVTPDVNQ